MNTTELKIEMLRHQESGESLSKMLGISRSTFSNKLNNNGAEFTQGEITAIKDRFQLSPERVNEIFFAKELSSEGNKE